MARRAEDGTDPDDIPSTICALPWLNLSLDVNGSSRPCCRFSQPDPASRYQLANLRDTDLEGVWNSEAMQLLRRDFLEGRRPAECSTCWDEEAAGIPSWRETFVDDRKLRARPDFSTVTPPQPVALDLKLSNACNMKCRICGPTASSLWLQEEVEHGSPAVAAELRAERGYLKSNKITQQQVNADTFARWVVDLEHVEMTGGEPMYSRENREIIDGLVTGGDPARTSLLITTNASIIDERIMEQLPTFGHVSIALSIDDIGERAAYERAPGRWQEVEANLLRYAELAGPRTEVWINASVSTLNAWYLPELLAWWLRTVPPQQVMLHLNLVHGPPPYDVRNLPDALKDRVADRLRDAARDARLPPEVAHALHRVTDFMCGTPADAGAWAQLWTRTAELDRIRSQSFAATYPELWQQIVELELGPPAPSSPRGTAVRLLSRLRRR